MSLRDLPFRAGRRIALEALYAGHAVRAGAIGVEAPRTVAGILLAWRRFGMLGTIPKAACLRYGRDRVAIIDERGEMTFGELEDAVNALANDWRRAGLVGGSTVGILCRNHRWILVAIYAAARCGARIVLLNTDFAGPQLREVTAREGTDLLVHDEEYLPLLEGASPRLGSVLAWTEDPAAGLAAVVAGGDPSPAPAAGIEARVILLTSGTTGTPKGAPRAEPKSLAPLGALLSKVPFRARGTMVLPAPVFHTLGFTQALLAGGLGTTVVLRRRFDPALVIEDLAAHRATAMVVVPVMLQKLVDLGPEAYAGRDLSRLEVILVAGSQLGADLAVRATEAFGPVIHNLYGSTEVAYATVATPADLAVAPGTVGKVMLGATVKILDDAGREVPTGSTGRIFVGNEVQFEGYTGGGDKERIRGLMSSGDVGHFDSAGRLYVDGRDDDMIVSGGENVFPGELEELLAAHPAIREVAAIGVSDERFGQRLSAFVVLHEGAELTEDDVREHVRENLARYKVPRDVHFLDELPRNPTGKVLKRRLAEGL